MMRRNSYILRQTPTEFKGYRVSLKRTTVYMLIVLFVLLLACSICGCNVMNCVQLQSSH